MRGLIEEKLEIKNKLGLHARAAALLVQLTNRYRSDIRIGKDGDDVDGKSIIELLTLAAECGSLINISVSGEDEKEAFTAVSELVDNKFNEE